jgi:hypothetical protein
MTRIDFAIRIIGRLHGEKSPPIVRYLCLLALAEANGQPLAKHEVFHRVGIADPHGGTLEAAARNGLIEILSGGPKRTYRITPEGIKTIRPFLDPAPTDHRHPKSIQCA